MKKVYETPLSVVMQIKIEELLTVASYVNHDGGDGNETIIDAGDDGPMPSKRWWYDDEEIEDIGNWVSFME